MVRVLAIGQSNLAALTRAAQMMLQEKRLPSGFAIKFIQILEKRYKPSLVSGVLNHAIADEVRAQLVDADVVVSCLGGNAHSMFGLLNHPQPYDFVVDADPLPRDRALVPAGLVRGALKESMDQGLKLFSDLRMLIDKPMVHCESPPPVPSEIHIRKHPGVFANRIDQLGISPAKFRLKLWKLQSDIYREFCDANDIEFLPVPAAVFDETGAMCSKAWAADPTHGNAWYGEQVLNQIAARSAGL
jgi:hypothetical protein